MNMENSKGEKQDNGKLPMGIVIQRQFPNALKAIAECSLYGHEKYKDVDQDWLNCQRLENPIERYSDAMMRHFLDSGADFKAIDAGEKGSQLEHIKHAAWNMMQLLEMLELQKQKDNE